MFTVDYDSRVVLALAIANAKFGWHSLCCLAQRGQVMGADKVVPLLSVHRSALAKRLQANGEVNRTHSQRGESPSKHADSKFVAITTT